MARHRTVRNIDLDDEYDDGAVYGHSYEDEVAFSPSAAQFMYRRGNDGNQPTLGSYFASTEASASAQYDTHVAESTSSIPSEPDPPDLSTLSMDDRSLLHSAMDHIRGVLGENFSEPTAHHLLISNNYDGEQVLDMLLSGNYSLHIAPPPPVVTMAVPSSAQVSTASASATICNRMPSSPAACLSPALSAANSKPSSMTSSPATSRADLRSISPQVSTKADDSSIAEDTAGSGRRSKAAVDIAAEYAKRQAGKELINMVVVGHVDAGKSTLMGHLLVKLGTVGKRTMHKYETESKKVGKGSFAYAWVLDETGEERSRGITMDVGIMQFETDNKIVTLLDAPGHRDFIPNTITGAAQADVALLVIDASAGGFESGFEAGGQTREHSLLLRSLGVQQVAVVINKLDTMDWSSDRFEEIVSRVKTFLRQAGFKESDVSYIPCSGLVGENLDKRSTCGQLTAWYSGPCLLEAINLFKIAERAIRRPFRLFISDVFKGMGSGITVSGKIESGAVQVLDRVNVIPASVAANCKALSLHDESVQWACAGDFVNVTLTGADMTEIAVGMVLCSPSLPIPSTTRFRARIVVFDIDVPITLGYQVMLHYQTVSEPAIMKRLVSLLGKNGAVTKKKPRCLIKHSNAIVELHTTRPVCIEAYKDFKELGRFMLRSGNATVAAGIVTEIL
ncbi:HBS1-like protein isoform X2 [Sycon ciliatum]|uniref:HBS1-like protein isoform X2 n=1 Tax=Sycon ciliatum TaxID=27933 RepID=UPI0031F641D9